MSEWKPIETATKNVDIDTFGFFIPYKRTERTWIRKTDDYISGSSPYPLTETYFKHDDLYGTYTRTHWMPLPEPPK